MERVVIVGAGPAGLAIATELRRRDVDPLVVEAGRSVATSWRSRHDRLRLNTHRVFSHQPGRRISRPLGPFPGRDEYVAYLESCADGIRIQFDTTVHRVGRADPGWRLTTSRGPIEAHQAILATGPDLEPVMPTWPGADTFTGELIHAGRVMMTPAIDHIDGRDVHFVDGTMCQPDIIVCATGYRPGLEPLVGHLVDLDRLGMPPFRGTTGSPAHPGLWFFGLNRSPYGNMHIRRAEARRLAKRLHATTPETT